MNQEERKLKRQQDTKNAMVIFIVFLAVVILAAAGAVFALNRFVFKDKKPDQNAVAENTEQMENTEEPAEPTAPVVDPAAQQAAEFVAGMTLEDKVAQMFMITPDALTGFEGVTAAGDTTKASYGNRPVGGIIYMGNNLKDREQTAAMLTNMQAIAQERTGLPAFLGVDEEGGAVARLAGNSAFGLSDVGNMSDIGATGDSQNAYNAGTVIGTYLKELGFNLDFAPVADVLTNSDNLVIGNRSFGSDSRVVADMVSQELAGLSAQGIYGTVKHFPGHGGAAEDSHEGAVVLEKTLEDLKAVDLIPFQQAIDSGVSFIMAGHISLPNVTGDDTPASLSKMMITDVLRSQMGYDGIVVTDALNMGAVTGKYTADQAAVMAVNAGVDLLLMPADYETAYQGVLKAVQDGTISEERINESVARIVKIKLQMK